MHALRFPGRPGTSSAERLRMQTLVRWALPFLALVQLSGCEQLDPTRNARREVSAQQINALLATAREDEKLADDVECALRERWPVVDEILRKTSRPIVTLAEVLEERGMFDAEANLPEGVFSDDATRRRYFAAVLLGWSSEPTAMKVAVRIEARRLASLYAARAELSEVDERVVLDQLVRRSSERLHGFCKELPKYGSACSDLLDEHGREVERPMFRMYSASL